MIGKHLSHYRIVEQIGEGGMGVIYRARDLRLDRNAVIKVLRSDAVGDPERRRRFVQEAKAASALNHPNIITVYDIDTADGVDFIAMEYVEGKPLDDVLAEGAVSLERILDFAQQIASALAAAHAAGIVHRDLKPANVMVTTTGQVKVLDFGLAKLTGTISGDVPVESLSTAAFTEPGLILGTVAYMSPEQAEGKRIDHRSDIFSFGAVLYEMLTRQRPFDRGTTLSTLNAILHDPPPPLRESRPDVPADVERIVAKSLAKSAESRYERAPDLLRDLTAARERLRSSSDHLGALFRQKRVWAPALLAFAVFVGIGAVSWHRASRLRWAREVAIPEVERLALEDRYMAAFRLAKDVEREFPKDPGLDSLWDRFSFPRDIRTEPAGALVFFKEYVSPEAEWKPLGATPLERVRLPFSSLRFRAEKEGLEPVEGALFDVTSPRIELRLHPKGSRPEGMVWVQGGGFRAGSAPEVQLEDFWLDRYEVANREFQQFVSVGGYRRRELWKHPFLEDGVEIHWEKAMSRFVDATGRPGPATWELGAPPPGTEDSPVGGVSWYEAAAYAEFAGKSLPTVYHWRRATGTDYLSDIVLLSNFGGAGPAAVGSHDGLGPYGTYDMAGNVKEWCFNDTDGNRYILGGAWNEPSYLYFDRDARGPFEREPNFGFRCARYAPTEAVLAPVESLTRDFGKEKPASDEAFGAFRALYSYDRTELNASVDGVDETELYRREKIAFDAAYGGERVTAWLFLPRNAAPPYQTVVYFPSGEAFELTSSDYLGKGWWLELAFRSGRALLHPVYKGTYERQVDVSGPNELRDVVIQVSKDLGRALDYLATRQDIDSSRLAYLGQSAGAELAPVLLGVEPRFKAAVLLWGGFDNRRQPDPIEPLNFAPRARQPLLMVNGRQDFIFPVNSSQLPLFHFWGAPENDKRHVLFDYGHIPLKNQDVIKEVLDWLDRYLGPVELSRQ